MSVKELVRAILNGTRPTDTNDMTFNTECNILCGRLHQERCNLTKDHTDIINMELIENSPVDPVDLFILNIVNEDNQIKHDNTDKPDVSTVATECQDLCIYCSKIVTDQDLALECEHCLHWQHIACQNILSVNDYEMLNNTDASKSFSWCCDNCADSQLYMKSAN